MRFIFSFLVVALAAAATGHKNPVYGVGRAVVVNLFEWKYVDVALECERFLGPNGYAGVQVSPPSENLKIINRPWWERYQPISYYLVSRSGNEAALRNAITRCNAVGVRVYVDVVINHMTAGGAGNGTGGTVNTGTTNYPAVPYVPYDFNADCGATPVVTPTQVRNCRTAGRHDLNQALESVRVRIVAYLNRLISFGVAGFRIDYARYIWPVDLRVIYSRLNNLVTPTFPANTRPFIYQDVVDIGGDVISRDEYTPLAAVTELKVSNFLGKVFGGSTPLSQLVNWGPAWGLVAQGDGVNFVDYHENQRGLGPTGPNTLWHSQPRPYRAATAFNLAHPYGEPHVFSSYSFTNPNQGPPQDVNGNIVSPTITPTGSCGSGWVCEHRWRQVNNLVNFRIVVSGTVVINWWDNGANQIAFGRGKRGFIVFNHDVVDLNKTLQTGLPGGTYCDVYTGEKVGTRCTGRSVLVYPDGTAYFSIPRNHPDSVVCIHVGVRSRI